MRILLLADQNDNRDEIVTQRQPARLGHTPIRWTFESSIAPGAARPCPPGRRREWSVVDGSNGKTLLATIESQATFRNRRMEVATTITEECPMTTPAKILFTANVHTTGGREGAARSSDGRLDVRLSPPGAAGSGTNPEELFAAGWSACFEGAMGIAARRLKITLPADLAIDAEVDLCLTDGAFFLQARLNVSVPGVEREVAQTLVDAAHQTCPYSKAIRGNVDVVITLI
jgi:osmotically inducible protein OsmC